jgi:hypothetical protein
MGGVEHLTLRDAARFESSQEAAFAAEELSISGLLVPVG